MALTDQESKGIQRFGLGGAIMLIGLAARLAGDVELAETLGRYARIASKIPVLELARAIASHLTRTVELPADAPLVVDDELVEVVDDP